MEAPLVSVVMPVYNKASTVKRAIQSVLSQSLSSIELIVVNDGSTDNSEEEIFSAIEGHDNCTYIYQENAGVAEARNNGVLNHSAGLFIVCLDSDDAIEKDYLRTLVAPMLEDNSLSITYTALRYIKPNGETGISSWPAAFDADAQMMGKNQIPTAAMVRRRVWERLGGQRKRFSPVGAGAEDADFWLRAVSYGFRARYIQAKRDTFFVYSFMSGLVSGNKNYREPNYREWYPWTSNIELMPTPSLATSPRHSHPARQYDDPLISIIIPVGPGHARHLVNALDSLDAQTFRRWEAIVVFDVSEDEWFGDLRDSGWLRYMERTWPFCRFMSTHSDGKLAREISDLLDVVESDVGLLERLPMPGQPAGAGAARNAGIERARAPLLFFLDADDWLVPSALRVMLDAYKERQEIIFSDHIAVAKIPREKLNQVDGKVVGFDERSGDAFIQQAVADYNCPRALEQPYMDGRPPYVICNVSAIVPKEWALAVGGFNDKLKSWEDVLFFWQLAWSGYCFHRVPQPLLVYRYYTGHRRELGRKYAPPLLQYLYSISEGTKKMGCGCKGGGSPSVRTTAPQSVVDGSEKMSRIRLSRGNMLEVADADLVMVEFNPPDIGDKTRYGMHDFGGGNVIVYGRFNKGDRIYAHRKDIEVDLNIARAQGREPMFIILGEPRDELEVEPVVSELAPPEEIAEAEWLIPDDVETGAVFEEEDSHAFLGEAEFTSQESRDADDYFPEPIKGFGRNTDIADLEVSGIKNPTRYIPLLREEGINNAWQLIRYEEDNEDGLAGIKSVGPKVQRAFLDAARKVV